MCKELCEASESGEMQSCQDCGKLICFEIENGDDVCRPAYVTSSGDLYCDNCGEAHDRAEDEEDEAFEYGENDCLEDDFEDE